MKTGLRAATAVIALTLAPASAGAQPASMINGTSVRAHVQPKAGLTFLWNQNSPNTAAVDSQNYTSGSYATFDDDAADDFVVPTGQSWTINEVDVSGLYFQGSGPAKSVDITIYRNKAGKRGKIDVPGNAPAHGTFTDLACTDNNGSFACTLPPYNVRKQLYLTLAAGHYWVSVVANCTYEGGCGEWGWSQNSTITGDAAEWENPNGGFALGCTTWNIVSTCGGSQYVGDFAFDLQGSVSGSRRH